MRIRKGCIGAVTGLGLVVVVFWFHLGEAPRVEGRESGEPKGRSESAHVRVRTFQLEEGRLPLTARMMGRIVPIPQSRASVVTLASGRVEEIAVREGDRIEKGQTLIKLDPRIAEAASLKARSAISMAEEELKYAEIAGLDRKQDELELLAAEARVRADQNRREAERLRALLAKELTSQKAATVAQQTAENSERDADLAEKRAETFRKAGRGLELVRLHSAVEQARANLRPIDVQLEAAVLKAPVSGRIARINVVLGQFVDIGTAMISIQQQGATGVVFQVPPRLAHKIEPGMKFLLESETAGRPRGTVLSIAASVDAASGLVNIAGDLEPDEHLLYLGEILPAEITLRPSASGFVVPLSALTTTDEGNFIHLIDKEGAAHPAPVEVLARTRHKALVRNNDLHAGAAVIVDGNYNLPEGTVVEPISK